MVTIFIVGFLVVVIGFMVYAGLKAKKAPKPAARPEEYRPVSVPTEPMSPEAQAAAEQTAQGTQSNSGPL